MSKKAASSNAATTNSGVPRHASGNTNLHSRNHRGSTAVACGEAQCGNSAWKPDRSRCRRASRRLPYRTERSATMQISPAFFTRSQKKSFALRISRGWFECTSQVMVAYCTSASAPVMPRSSE